ncbi:587_t:CDS:2, partial [Scutellospora calospora]
EQDTRPPYKHEDCPTIEKGRCRQHYQHGNEEKDYAKDENKCFCSESILSLSAEELTRENVELRREVKELKDLIASGAGIEKNKIDDYKNPQFCAYEEKDGARVLPSLWLDDNKTQVNPRALLVQDKDGNFVDGVSIMEPGVLAGYLTRALLTDADINNMKLTINEGKNEKYNKKADQIKHKETLNYLKKAIIVFDEAHYSFDPAYQKLIERAILLGHDVIKMSATFEGMPFSTTSSYNIDTPKRILNSRNVVQMVGGLTEEQKNLLKNSKIPYVILDKNYESAAKGIVDGLPKGSLVI